MPDDRTQWLQRLDSVCDEFESQWRSRPMPPSLEAFIGRCEPEARANLLAELLPLDIEYRLDNGQQPTAEQYLARFPKYAAVVQAVFARRAALPETLAWETTRPVLEDVAPLPPGRVGDYELLKEIARGGMGVVYQARQLSRDRVVAVKMIRAGPAAPPEFVARFLREAQVASRLDHPGIVAIYEVGEEQGQHYFAMEYVEGRTLSDVIRDGLVACRQAAVWVHAIAEAVHYAHEQGVLHRDLKPANVLLDRQGRLRITDFGLARRADGGGQLTVMGDVLGTPGFMSPEQARGEIKRIDRRSDVHALGAVLYALLTGRPPYRARTAEATLLETVQTAPAPPSRLNAEVDAALERICLKCLEKNPRKRYATAQELAHDLEQYLESAT